MLDMAPYKCILLLLLLYMASAFRVATKNHFRISHYTGKYGTADQQTALMVGCQSGFNRQEALSGHRNPPPPLTHTGRDGQSSKHDTFNQCIFKAE